MKFYNISEADISDYHWSWSFSIAHLRLWIALIIYTSHPPGLTQNNETISNHKHQPVGIVFCQEICHTASLSTHAHNIKSPRVICWFWSISKYILFKTSHCIIACFLNIAVKAPWCIPLCNVPTTYYRPLLSSHGLFYRRLLWPTARKARARDLHQKKYASSIKNVECILFDWSSGQDCQHKVLRQN